MNTNIFKTIILVAFTGLFSSNASAQEIKVRNIAHLTTDISARSAVRLDANNKECAIVRVNIPSLKTMDFGNAIVGKAEYNAGEYLLYVPDGTKQIPLSVNGYKESVIDFDQYGVSVEGKNVYRVTLYIDNGKTVASGKHGSMKITTEPESSYILMDGMPVGETPLLIKDVAVGEHFISFPNTSGYTLLDQAIPINENETFERHYVLEENTDVFAWEEEIPMFINDNDGAYAYPLKYKRKTVNGKRGVQTYWGVWVVPCGKFEYVNADNYRLGDSDVFEVGNYDYYDNLQLGLYQPGKGLLFPCGKYSYFNFSAASDNIIIVSNANKSGILEKWGLVDLKGQEILPCIYEHIDYYRKEKIFVLRFVVNDKTKYKVLNVQNEMAYNDQQREYDELTDFHEGMAGAKINDNEYIINCKGQIVTNVPPLYSYGDCPSYEPGCYTEGLLCLQKRGDRENTYGVLNSNGKELTSFTYRKEYVKNGWILLYNEEERVAVDQNEHIYKMPKTDECNVIGNYLCCSKNGKYGLLDQEGNTVLPFEYGGIYSENEHSLRSSENDNYIISYKENKIIIFDMNLQELLTIEDAENVSIKRIKDGIIVLGDEESNRYGFMNFKGEVLAGCLF